MDPMAMEFPHGTAAGSHLIKVEGDETEQAMHAMGKPIRLDARIEQTRQLRIGTFLALHPPGNNLEEDAVLHECPLCHYHTLYYCQVREMYPFKLCLSTECLQNEVDQQAIEAQPEHSKKLSTYGNSLQSAEVISQQACFDSREKDEIAQFTCTSETDEQPSEE